jgi:hypothetical protein
VVFNFEAETEPYDKLLREATCFSSESKSCKARNGPVRRTYEQRMLQKFLRPRFAGLLGHLAWEPMELTDSSMEGVFFNHYRG